MKLFTARCVCCVGLPGFHIHHGSSQSVFCWRMFCDSLDVWNDACWNYIITTAVESDVGLKRPILHIYTWNMPTKAQRFTPMIDPSYGLFVYYESCVSFHTWLALRVHVSLSPCFSLWLHLCFDKPSFEEDILKERYAVCILTTLQGVLSKHNLKTKTSSNDPTEWASARSIGISRIPLMWSLTPRRSVASAMTGSRRSTL